MWPGSCDPPNAIDHPAERKEWMAVAEQTSAQDVKQRAALKADVAQQRWELLDHIHALLDKPMIVLAFVWLVLLIADFVFGLRGLWSLLSNAIWLVFIADFLFELLIAPKKWDYLRGNWLVALSLALPALRLLRMLSAVRLLSVAVAPESVGLVRILGGVNRGMNALNHALRQHRIGYVVLLTALVTLLGAAGMLSFESRAPGRQGFATYGDALWWTAMVMTTMGSQYWPQTLAGRILAFLLALYAFAIFGYITATIATLFLGRQQRQAERVEKAGRAAQESETQALRDEIGRLRAEMARMLALLAQRDGPPPREPASKA
jgi:voltage-gated potassium channel